MSEPPVPEPDASAPESVTAATTSTAIDAKLPLPVAPRDMFYDLTVYIPPKPQPASGNEQPGSTSSGSETSPATPPITDYDKAITRVRGLATFLTPNMRCSLTSMLSVVQSHLVSPGLEGGASNVQTLITRVASTEETSDLDIKEFVDTIEKGLIAFTALGGGSLPQSALAAGGPHKRIKINGSLFKSSHRSQKVRRECERRDGKGCQICNSVNPGEVVHIIPYSVKDSKGIDFWRFIELFRGRGATAALKAVALAPTPESVDQLKNVWYLCKQCHSCFGGGRLAVIPDVAGIAFPFDTAQTTSYKAHIEFPAGLKGVVIARWKPDEDGDWSLDRRMSPGDEITLKTHDTLELPVPHPLLFQLHAIISRVIALKAAAGFPLFPGFDRDLDDEELAVPAFTDTSFENWEAQHKKPSTAPNPARYDSPATKSHILRWFELTPHQPRYGPWSSESGSDGDDELPRRSSVVLSEVGQRMEEKRRIAEDRWMQLFEPEPESDPEELVE